jgi:ankyrin repeat protein
LNKTLITQQSIEQDNEEFTPLMAACRYQYLDCAEVLIEFKAEIDYLIKDDISVLIYCCYHLKIDENNLAAIDFILSHKANINHIDKECNTALKIACKTDNIELAKLLLDKGANPNIGGRNSEYISLKCDPIYYPPLFICIQDANISLIELLLETKANLIRKNSLTVFSLCKNHNNTNILKFLLDSRYNTAYNVDLDINSVDNSGNSALMNLFGKPDVVHLLINSNADVNIANKYGYTVLMRYCNNMFIPVLKVLLQYKDESGIDIDQIDKNGNTCLMNACKSLNKSLVEILLNARADTNIVNNEGKNALTICTSDEIRNLLENEMSVKYVLK